MTDQGQRFSIEIGRRTRPFLLLWGVRSHNAYVDLDVDLEARFGFFRFRTPVANIARYRIEGPWLWITAIGVRRGVRRGDITFAGTHRGGFRLDFRERVKWGPLRVPTLYVTVADVDAFGAALRARGIPGEDARRE